MICVTKKYADTLSSWKKADAPLACFLHKTITKKHFIQLKTNAMIGRETTISFRLSSIYYSFGCKKYICKKSFMKNGFGFMGSMFDPCKGLIFVNLSYPLRKVSLSMALMLFTNIGVVFWIKISPLKGTGLTVLRITLKKIC